MKKIAVNLKNVGSLFLRDDYYNHLKRDDPELIKYIEDHKDNIDEIQNGELAEIQIIEIPDNSIDWKIFHFVGPVTKIWYERVEYTCDGRIYYAVYPSFRFAYIKNEEE